MLAGRFGEVLPQPVPRPGSGAMAIPYKKIALSKLNRVSEHTKVAT